MYLCTICYKILAIQSLEFDSSASVEERKQVNRRINLESKRLLINRTVNYKRVNDRILV